MHLENICKSISLKNETIDILKDISGDFKENTLYVISGASGAGKSTLVKILGLMLGYTSGLYMLDGQDVSKLSNRELAKIRMKKIGFIFQDYNLDEYLTAIDNVMLPMYINKEIRKEDRYNKAYQLLKSLGLETRINHKPKAMSGGECQRVAIARALANDPKIILADEPTGNLDKDNEKMVFLELKKLSQMGKCVIVVSHSSEALMYADKVLILENGNLKRFTKL